MRSRFWVAAFAGIVACIMILAGATSLAEGGWGRRPGGHKGGASGGKGDDVGPTACTRAANAMFRSCGFEVNEEYHATIGACINFADPRERWACRNAAAQARSASASERHDQKEARIEVCKLLDEGFYDSDPLTDERIDFVDPDGIGESELPNSYFSLEAGHTFVLRAGEDFEETIVVHVTDEVLDVLGVACRLVVDIVLLEEDDGYVAVEVTDDFYAQSTDGDVYYCGEVARNFEDGRLTNLDGSFLAGVDLAKAGVLIKAAPRANDAHRQEYKLGEAKDVIRYVGLNEAPTEAQGGENPDPRYACAANGGCLQTEEFIPPNPAAGEFKYFLAGTGLVLGVGLEDGEPTGDRDELLCVGGSLDVLGTADCGIDEPDQLLEQLCKLSPDAFCEDN